MIVISIYSIFWRTIFHLPNILAHQPKRKKKLFIPISNFSPQSVIIINVCLCVSNYFDLIQMQTMNEQNSKRKTSSGAKNEVEIVIRDRY